MKTLMRDPQMTGYGPHPVAGVTPEDVTLVESRSVSCDGGKASPNSVSGGHPLIWMRIEHDEVTCPYCSRTYRLKDGAGDDGHH
jgi:uncharacterized Zn-finger protein